LYGQNNDFLKGDVLSLANHKKDILIWISKSYFIHLKNKKPDNSLLSGFE
jgi:hypothetical protein